MGYETPADPPFALGTRIRFTGNDFGHYREPDDSTTVVWVRSGDIGVVVKNTDGSPSIPGIDDHALDGWSTVRFGDFEGNDRALTADVLAYCEDDDEQDGTCIRHGGHFTGEGNQCTAAHRYTVIPAEVLA